MRGSFLLPIFWLVPQAPLAAAMASRDRDTLAALFRVTNGESWRRKDNWGTDAELGAWYGIEVNDENRVIRINLNFNNLRGTCASLAACLATLSRISALRETHAFI